MCALSTRGCIHPPFVEGVSVTYVNSRDAWFTLRSFVSSVTLCTVVTVGTRKSSVTRRTLRGDGRGGGGEETEQMNK